MSLKVIRDAEAMKAEAKAENNQSKTMFWAGYLEGARDQKIEDLHDEDFAEKVKTETEKLANAVISYVAKMDALLTEVKNELAVAYNEEEKGDADDE